jgi:hypothetical protein
MSNKSNDYKNDEVKSIVLGLFALIGFIIIIYSIFMGAVGEPLASTTDTVFVAAILDLYFGRKNCWSDIFKEIIPLFYFNIIFY